MPIKILALDGLTDTKLCNLVEQLLCTIDGIDNAHIDFLSQRLTLTVSGNDSAEIVETAVKTLRRNIPGVTIRLTNTLQETQNSSSSSSRVHEEEYYEMEPPPPQAESLVEEESSQEEHRHLFHTLPEPIVLSICSSGIALAGLVFLYFTRHQRVAPLIFACLSFCCAGAAHFMIGTNSQTNPPAIHYTLLSVLTVVFFVDRQEWAVLSLLIYYVAILGARYILIRINKTAEQSIDIQPDKVMLRQDSAFVLVPLSSIVPGNSIQVSSYSTIPFTGIVLEGTATIHPFLAPATTQEVKEGDTVHCGDKTLAGTLLIQVTLAQDASAAAFIRENIVTHSFEHTPLSVQGRVLRFTCMLVGSIGAVVLPFAFYGINLNTSWIFLATRLLAIVLFPCGLFSAASLLQQCSVLYGLRRGFLPGSGKLLSMLASVKTVLLGYTGFLTNGDYVIEEIQMVENIELEEFLDIVAAAEANINHPIALALSQECRSQLGRVPTPELLQNVERIPGYGVRARQGQWPVLVGSEKLMNELGIPFPLNDDGRPRIYVTIRNELAGIFILSDPLKNGVQLLCDKFRQWGFPKIGLLGSSDPSVVKSAAATLEANLAYSLQSAPEWRQLAETLHGGTPESLLFVGTPADSIYMEGNCLFVEMGTADPDRLPGPLDLLSSENSPEALESVMKISRRIHHIFLMMCLLFIGGKISLMWAAVQFGFSLPKLTLLNVLLGILLYFLAVSPMLIDWVKEHNQSPPPDEEDLDGYEYEPPAEDESAMVLEENLEQPIEY